MKIKIITAILASVLLSLFVLCSCTPQGGQTSVTDTDAQSTDTSADSGQAQPTELQISSISEYNKTSEKNSHSKESAYSALETNYRQTYAIDQSGTSVSTMFYPRLKKTADGKYLMFYQNSKTGTSVYVSQSSNLKQWGGATKLFAKTGSKFYATADACVLKNGDIIVVASFNGDYDGDPKLNGLAMKRSTDNGATWSEEQVIYVGTTWEPSILQLESGEIQVYWTNTHVKGVDASHGGRTDDNSTGTMMIRSFDNGQTWTGDLSVAYGGQIVAQQLTKKGSDGNYYSGQMPVAVQLNDGNIALALEARLPTSSGSNTYNVSFAYSPGENSWQDALGEDQEGPSTLKKNMFTKMAGPYLRQFVSGETLLSYHWGNKWYVKLGNSTATSFYDSYEAFADTKINMWGSLEITDSHVVTGVVPADGNALLHVGNMYLNHTVAANSASITLDGSNDDWTNVDEAFFVGSNSQAQTAIRTAQDDENMYFYAEVLDYYVSDKDRVSFVLSNGVNQKYYNISVYANGEISAVDSDSKEVETGVEAKVLVDGTVDVYDDKDKGYVIELKVSKTLVGGGCSYVIFDPILYNKDKASQKAESDTVGGLSIVDCSNWLHIDLK